MKERTLSLRSRITVSMSALTLAAGVGMAAAPAASASPAADEFTAAAVICPYVTTTSTPKYREWQGNMADGSWVSGVRVNIYQESHKNGRRETTSRWPSNMGNHWVSGSHVRPTGGACFA